MYGSVVINIINKKDFHMYVFWLMLGTCYIKEHNCFLVFPEITCLKIEVYPDDNIRPNVICYIASNLLVEMY